MNVIKRFVDIWWEMEYHSLTESIPVRHVLVSLKNCIQKMQFMVKMIHQKYDGGGDEVIFS
jgi:hypothetical protein